MSRLGWLLEDDLPLLSTVDPKPWTDVPDDLFGQSARLLRPLVRALLLAGYRSYKVDFVRSGVNPEVVSLTPGGGLTAGTVAELGAPMPRTGSGVAITVADLVHDRAERVADAGGWTPPQGTDTSDPHAAFSHALPVEASDDAPWTGVQPGAGGNVVVWSGNALTARNEAGEVVLGGPWIEEIAKSVRDIANDIRDVLEDRLSQGRLTPLSRAGLLWLFNPLFWYAHDTTFPGTAFSTSIVGAPSPSLAWPAVTSPAARDLDPLKVLSQAPAPAGYDVRIMVTQAAELPPVLTTAGTGEIVLDRLIFGRTIAYIDNGRAVVGWNEGRDSDFATLLTANPSISDPPTRGRHMVASVRALLGPDGKKFADAMFAGKPNWFEVLMDLAEMGVLAPAGYPADLAGAGDQTTGVSDVDEVRPMYYPAAGKSSERVVLEINGLPAVTVSATALCEVPLLRAFAWDFLAADPPDRLLTLMVVAGPGVEVSPGPDRGLRWDLKVIRVWDYYSVPPRGARVQPELILSPFPLAWQPTTPDRDRYPNGMPLYGLQVLPLPQGVALEYPIPTKEGDTPEWRVTATAPEGSGRSRIAYSITFGHGELATDDHEPVDPASSILDEPSAAAVSMWVSPDVSVRFELLRGSHSPAPAGSFAAWKVTDPARIPLQGACLPYPGIFLEPALGPRLPIPVDLPQGANQLDFPPEPHDDTYVDLLRFMVDIGVGAIPLVGDLVDIAELTVSLYTGKDKWGRPMTRFEQLVMVGCLLVPGVSNGAAKLFAGSVEETVDASLGFALELRRRANQPLLEFVTALRDNVPEQIQRTMDDLVGSVRAEYLPRLGPDRDALLVALRDGISQNLVAAQRLGEAVSPQLAHDAPRFLLIDLLTDAVPVPDAPMLADRQFWLPALQGPFVKWCRENRRRPGEEAVRYWVTTRAGGADGVPRAILEALLGFDVITQSILEGKRAVRTEPLAAPWQCLATMVYRGRGAMNAEGFGQTGLEPVMGQVRWLVAEVQRMAALGPSRLSTDHRLLDFADPQRMVFLADRVEQLLRGLSPTRPLRPNADELQNLLLGANRSIDPRDMGEVLLRGVHEVDLLLSDMRQATNVAELTSQAFLRFSGHHTIFKDLLTGSSPQHASLFEVRSAAEEFIRRRLAGEAVPENGFMMQPISPDGQKGPDLMRLFEGYLQIVESKSWTNAWMAGQPNSSMFRQIERFIGFAEAGIRFTLNGVAYPTHPTIILRFNPAEYARLRQISDDEAKKQIRAFLSSAESTLDNIREDHQGWEIIIEQEELYVEWQ